MRTRPLPQTQTRRQTVFFARENFLRLFSRPRRARSAASTSGLEWSGRRRTKRPRRRSIDRPTGDRQPRLGGSCQSFFARRLIAASAPPRVFLRPTKSCIWSRSGADDRRNRSSPPSPYSHFPLFSVPIRHSSLRDEAPPPKDPHQLSPSLPLAPSRSTAARTNRAQEGRSLARPPPLSSVCLPLASEIGNQIRLSHRAYPLVPLSVNSSFRNTMDLSPSTLRPF